MIYTFGHSTLPEGDASNLLAEHDVDLLVDIRSHPVSKWPWWCQDNMDWLPIERLWLPGLGGWAADVATEEEKLYAASQGVEVNAYTKGFFPRGHISKTRTRTSGGLAPTWTSVGLFEYSWFMTCECFFDGIDTLVGLAAERTPAIMCSESLWWKCHRSMVADALTFRDYQQPTPPVYHLQPKLTLHPIDDRLARYEPEILDRWEERWSPMSGASPEPADQPRQAQGGHPSQSPASCQEPPRE